MAGRTPRRDKAADIQNALVAAVTRYAPGSKVTSQYRASDEWQRECYRHYAICGEARFAARFFGSALSRAEGSLAKPGANGPQAVTSGAGFEAFSEMFGNEQGRKAALNSIGQHLTIAGECYVVSRAVQEKEEWEGERPGDNIWEVLSILEIAVSGSTWTVKKHGHPDVVLAESDVVFRIWLPDPAVREKADSPFKALLPVLSEIEHLTLHIFAQVRSRLLGAGILWVSQGLTFPPPPEVDGQAPDLNEAQALMMSLADAMIPAVRDQGSPASVVPIVITAPGDEIDKQKLMHFWSDLDAKALEMRNDAIHRFALGMDLPPEQILGMSSNPGTGGGNSNGVSHWGAWQIEEATIKLHIEPMLDAVAAAWTEGYVRPAGEGDTDEYIVFSTETLRLRPDRSQESILLYNLGLLKGEVVVKENGFTVEDMPDETERKTWLLLKVATGSATPEQVAAALRELGVDLGDAVGVVPRETRPDPSMDPLPPPRQEPQRQALVAASDALVFRALERAGNRLRQSVGKPPGVPSYETHTMVRANGSGEGLLEDAWSCAPQVLAGIADPQVVIPVLSAYCQMLFAEQQPHDRDRMRAWLERGVPA